MELFRQYHLGATVEELALQTGLPQDRIRVRLRAAALCFLSLGADRSFPLRFDNLEPFEIDWELFSFD
jgi:hypothetical protein